MKIELGEEIWNVDDIKCGGYYYYLYHIPNKSYINEEFILEEFILECLSVSGYSLDCSMFDLNGNFLFRGKRMGESTILPNKEVRLFEIENRDEFKMLVELKK